MPLRTASDDPSELAPEQRLHELAAILAEGLHRLRHQAILLTHSDEDSAGSALNSDLPEQIQTESSPKGLELSASTRPDRVGG